MDMSLDDIIKQNKKKGQGQRNGQPNKRKGGKPGAAGSRPGGKGKPAVSPKRNTNQGMRKPGGGVLKGRNQGGITKRNSGGFGRSLTSQTREAFLGAAASRRFGSGKEATKLIVSNLDFGVTDSDIVELFGEFGPLKSAGVHYDRSGRSLGSADLLFERRADAIKAMKQYNGVPLDGREMKIQLAISEIPTANVARPSAVGRAFNKPQNSNRSNNKPRGAAGKPNQKKTQNQNQNQGGKRGNKSGGRQKKAPPPTAEELDAQLEEYVKGKVATTDGA